ncbi:alpha-galactosidase [Lentisphaera marina]|uniref:glycoside hydrolase family 36 protein n=1 Tax=Lentisphaera marina TaxID=1111041 RepID=UPI002366CF2D|nr:glycoside hydrolase family 36 protein [Lentisphaera marina]MDD7984031.1 alpha-galactosidase [Lentisphaera marina]
MIKRNRFKLFSSLFIASMLSATAAEATFTPKADTYTVKSDFSANFTASASAVYNVDGKNHRVGTKSLPLNGKVSVSTVSTPFGDAIQSEATYGADGADYKFTLKIKQLKDLKAFTVQGIFHNHSDKNAKLATIDLFDTMGGTGQFEIADPAKWLITPLMQHDHAKTLAEMNGSAKEVALFVNTENDKSFLMGPAGPAEAHCRVEIRGKEVKAYAEMDRVLVEPGESRRSEEMLFIFEDAKTNTDVWTKWVAHTHKALSNKGPVYGWCSWYDRTTKIDEAHVMDVLETLDSNPNTFGKGIVQIDDGYQIMDGNWNGNAKFPSNMSRVAKKVREAGMIPGVWFAPLMVNPEHPWKKANPEAIQTNAKGISSFMNPNPFHPDGANWINPSHPKSKKFLRQVIETARDNGYGYIKIDFNGIGNQFVDPKITRLQAFRNLYTLYRDAAGEDMYILSCLGQPTRGVIGFVNAARVGPDSHPAHFSHCLESVLRFQIFNRVWWNNDADVSYLDVKLPSRRVGYTPQGEDMWKTWHNTVALTGGTAMISEPVNKDDVKAVWRNYEIMRPGSAENSRLLTLGKSAENSVFGFNAQRTYGNFAVYNLYNSDKEKSHDISIDFVEAGLPADTNCAIYDFWKNEVTGYTKDSYTAKALAKNASELLRFTPIKGGAPQLVGSNLHLSIGATEVKEIFTTKSMVNIKLTNAGAQNGDLIFYSEKELTAGSAENCKIAGIAKAGKNLWKVSLTGRKFDTKQSVSLKIK